MEVLDAIRERRSMRAFKPDSVSDEIIRGILGVAGRAPSSVNIQPWEFFVVKGEKLEAFRRANLEEFRSGKTPEPELPLKLKGTAPALAGVFRERQVELAKGMFGLLGIAKGDTKAQQDWTEHMVQFYGAPVAIIVVTDRMLEGPWPILDIGFVCQNILLAAQEYGLGTCVMRAIVDYPQVIRRVVGVPESKRIMVGVAMGHPDENHPVNRLITSREDLDSIVTFVES